MTKKKKKNTVITAASCMKLIANLAGKYQRERIEYILFAVFICTHTHMNRWCNEMLASKPRTDCCVLKRDEVCHFVLSL